MAHSKKHGLCSNGVVRLAFVLLSVCLVGYTISRQSLWSLQEKRSCSCLCDCSKDYPTIPIYTINDSLSDCGKHEPELRKEMEKDIVALMSEELSLQQTVANETMQRSEALLTSARRVSSHYQKEAEKCNAGIETCEEARERAEAQLAEELRLSELWERRARELGWEENSMIA